MALTYSGATILTLWGVIEIFLRIDPFLGVYFKHLDWLGWALAAAGVTALILPLRPPAPWQTSPRWSWLLPATIIGPLLVSAALALLYFTLGLENGSPWWKPIFLIATAALSGWSVRLVARLTLGEDGDCPEGDEDGESARSYSLPTWFDLPLSAPVLLVGLAAILVSVGRARDITAADIAQEELRQAGLSYSMESLQSAIFFVSSRSVELFRRAEVDADDIMIALGMPTGVTGGQTLTQSVLARLDPSELDCSVDPNANACRRIDNFLRLFWPPNTSGADDPGTEYCRDLARPVILAPGNRDGAPARPLLSHAFHGGHGAIMAKIIEWCGPLPGDTAIVPLPEDHRPSETPGTTAAAMTGDAAQTHAALVLDPHVALDRAVARGDARWTPDEVEAVKEELSKRGIEPLAPEGKALKTVAATGGTSLRLGKVSPGSRQETEELGPEKKSKKPPARRLRVGHLLRIENGGCRIDVLQLLEREAAGTLQRTRNMPETDTGLASMAGYLRLILGAEEEREAPIAYVPEDIGETRHASLTIGAETYRSWVQDFDGEKTRIVWERPDGTFDALRTSPNLADGWMVGDSEIRSANGERRVAFLPERAGKRVSIGSLGEAGLDWSLPARLADTVPVVVGEMKLEQAGAVAITSAAPWDGCLSLSTADGIGATIPLIGGERPETITRRLPKGNYDVVLVSADRPAPVTIGNSSGAKIEFESRDLMDCWVGGDIKPRSEQALLSPGRTRTHRFENPVGPHAVCQFRTEVDAVIGIEATYPEDVVLDLIDGDGDEVVSGFDSSSTGPEGTSEVFAKGGYTFRVRRFEKNATFDGQPLALEVSMTEVNPLEFGKVFDGRAGDGESVWHSIDLPDNLDGGVVITLDGMSQDLDLSVEGDDISQNSTASGTAADQVVLGEAGGMLMIEVSALSSGSAYKLTVEESVETQADGETLELGKTVSGRLEGGGSALHSLPLDKAGLFSVRLDGLSADLDLLVSGGDGETVAESSAAGANADEAVFRAEDGRLDVMVSALTVGSPYTLTARRIEPELLPLGEAVEGKIVESGRSRYYRLAVERAAAVRLALGGLGADLDLLVTREGAPVASGELLGAEAETVEFEARPGAYLVEVRAVGPSPYTLKAEAR